MSRDYDETNVETDPALVPLGNQGGGSVQPINVPQIGAISSIDGQPGPVIAINTGAPNKGLAVGKSSGANSITFSISGVTTALQESSGPTVLDIGAVALGQYLKRGPGNTLIGDTIAGGGDALKADPLSQFAATTSLELKGVISDETGSGPLVFGTSPNITTPTGIVKGDVGLGNVDNTSDVNKPVSTAQQTALNLKANIASPTFTGAVTLANDVWHLSGEAKQRLHFGGNSTTYLKSGNTSGIIFEFRNSADAVYMQITGTAGAAQLVLAANTVLTFNADTGLGRTAVDQLEINNGTLGQFRDLKVRDLLLSGVVGASSLATDGAGKIIAGVGGGGALAMTQLAPTADQTVTAGYSAYAVDYFEIPSTFFLEIGDGAVMEAG